MHPEIIFEWPDFTVCTIKEILSNTLECAYSFLDAYREMITAITRVETLQVGRIEMQAKACNSKSIDDFNKVHAITRWNPSEREEVIHFRNMRKIPGSVYIQTAVKSISSVCEGILCGRMVEEAEFRVSNRLFLLETTMYATWYAVPIVHWMRTIIQVAASSKLDLTQYQDTTVKVATEHREPIVQYHNELSQIIGQNAMKNVDSVLKIRAHEMTTSTSDITSMYRAVLTLKVPW